MGRHSRLSYILAFGALLSVVCRCAFAQSLAVEAAKSTCTYHALAWKDGSLICGKPLYSVELKLREKDAWWDICEDYEFVGLLETLYGTIKKDWKWKETMSVQAHWYERASEACVINILSERKPEDWMETLLESARGAAILPEKCVRSSTVVVTTLLISSKVDIKPGVLTPFGSSP